MVQVESPAALPVLVFLDDRAQKAEIGAIGQRSQTDTAIVSRPGNPDASVWVRATYRGYRTACIAFLNQVYGTEATPADLVGYDIDHLLTALPAPTGPASFASKAIRADVNQAWGRLFEKAASDP